MPEFQPPMKRQLIEEGVRPEMLASRRAGVMLTKNVLYVVLLLFFCGLGSGIVSRAIHRNAEGIFHTTSNGVIADFSCLLNWEFVFLHAVIALPTCVGMMYLAHALQRGLSDMMHNENAGLAPIDRCFTVLNALSFCFGIVVGFIGTTFSISWDYGI